MIPNPLDGANEPPGQELYVEPSSESGVFLWSEEVEEDRRDVRGVQNLSDRLVSRTISTASTAVREHDDTDRLGRQRQ